MANDSYWHRQLSARISRRRALAGGGLAAGSMAALSLVGCSSSGGSKKVDTGIAIQGGLATPKDTSSIAVEGGTYKTYATADVQTFDVGETSNFTAYAAAPFIYSRILKLKSGLGIPAITDQIDGDLAEKWEVLPDGTQWTFHLRPNVKMHNVPPLNGRDLDIGDVSISWERFIAKNPRKIRYDMIDSVETPDAHTIVFKLKFPYAPFGIILADASSFWVMPKEVAQGSVDYRARGAGSGPYVLDQYNPSSFYNYKRHDAYFLPGLPYIDTWEYPIVAEYATRLAEFKAGNIYALTPNSSDIINLKSEVPNALIYQGDFTLGWPVIFFGKTDPVWHGLNGDVRLRRAMSMALDRDQYIDTVYSTSELEKAGFTGLESRWDNMISSGWPQWLDPRSKEMGYPDSGPGQWFKHDPTAAKQLLSAAGYPNGLDTEIHYATIFLSGATFRSQIDITVGFLQDVGIRAREVGEDFNSVYLPKTVAAGTFNGFSASPSGEYNEVDTLLKSQWTVPSDRNPVGYNDPALNDLIEKQRRTLDAQARKSVIADIQKFVADRLWGIPWGGQANSSFTFAYPWMQNVQVYRSVPDLGMRLWIDQSKLKS